MMSASLSYLWFCASRKTIPSLSRSLSRPLPPQRTPRWRAVQRFFRPRPLLRVLLVLLCVDLLVSALYVFTASVPHDSFVCRALGVPWMYALFPYCP